MTQITHYTQVFVETTLFFPLYYVQITVGGYFSSSCVTTNSISKAKRVMRPLCLFLQNYEQHFVLSSRYVCMTKLAISKKSSKNNNNSNVNSSSQKSN